METAGVCYDEIELVLEDTLFKTPFERLSKRLPQEAWQEAQRSSASMRVAELGTLE